MFRYADQHFYSAETFVENTSALADNAEVRERIFQGFRSEIIRLADGEDAVEEEDPAASLSNPDGDQETDDEDNPIADPVTEARNARDQAIRDILVEVLDSDLYDEVFVEALRGTQAELVRSAELESTDLLRDQGQVNFNLRGLYPSIYDALRADERTAAIAENALPEQYGIFSIADRSTTIDPVWAAIGGGPGWRTTTYAGAVLALIAAVLVAERRPSRAIQFGFGMAGSAIVVVVLIYITRALVPLLAGGGASGGPVVAVYAANVWPLVRMMIWVLGLGVALAFAGWIARLIWPDDWVYSHVADDRGVRSIMRRRGAPEPTPQVAAAAAPVQYPGYAQPYPQYPAGWVQQPYPGQPYPPPGYGQYPVGPYAQPAMGQVPPYTPGRPTVPIMPIDVETGRTQIVTSDGVATPAAGLPLPADAAQAVPRVVTDNGSGETPQLQGTVGAEPDDAAPADSVPAGDADPEPSVEAVPADSETWSEEPDW